ncbi:Fibromodulin [Aix galericulata]|nr:Fibromodulin [Aix galericulata]
MPIPARARCPQTHQFSISSFCTVVDVMNYSRLQVLRLDGNEIKRNAVPPDAPLCLRRATIIEI